MLSFSDLFLEEYNTLQNQWENSLKQELKLEEVAGKITKRHLDLGNWPTLGLSASAVHLPGQTSWKKAAQTYFSTEQLVSFIEEDLEAGVRVFFLPADLSSEHWESLQKILLQHLDAKDFEIISLHQHLPAEPKLKIIDQSQLVHARDIHDQGGHNVQELAVLTLRMVERLAKPVGHLALCLDSHFFKNIAKIRALRLLSARVAETAQIQEPKIIALNSYREWTLYERYSNMLRNNVQVACGYIGGADLVQSSGYQAIFELEASSSQEHADRSYRMARNTAHILALESMLGVVEDAAFGSYHLESLSQKYAEEAWTLMQKLLALSVDERDSWLATEMRKVREQRQERVRTRKDVLAGMNDFPDARERLGIQLKSPQIFRVAREFEELRLRIENFKAPPKVQILLQGEYAALSNRINFIKNYFEVMGLEVLDPMSKECPADRIVVLCAKDEDYLSFAQGVDVSGARACFVAGKVEVPGFDSIFAGQNIFSVLSSLAQKLGA